MTGGERALSSQRVNLRILLGLQAPLAAAFGLLFGCGALAFHSLRLGLCTGLVLAYAGAGLLARRILERGHPGMAAALTASSLLLVSLLGCPLLPVVHPALLIVSVLSVTIALPYLSGSALKGVLALALLVILCSTPVGILLPPSPGIPTAFALTLTVATVGAASAMLFLVLWQFRALSLELEEAEEHLQEENRYKDQFLAMLGHELRNPLASILTSLELMKLKELGAGKEREVIDRQVRHLRRLVEDILDVSRLARGKVRLERERVELAELVDRAVEVSKPLIEAKRHTLTVEVPRSGLPLEVDPTRLIQVIWNLLDNAAKYMDPGGSITLTARAEGPLAVLSVRDRGMGVPREMLARLFKPFVQTSRSLDRSRGGLGLGLALVKQLINLHEGEVSLRSAGWEQGTEVTVTLPLAAPAASWTTASDGPPAIACEAPRSLSSPG